MTFALCPAWAVRLRREGTKVNLVCNGMLAGYAFQPVGHFGARVDGVRRSLLWSSGRCRASVCQLAIGRTRDTVPRDRRRLRSMACAAASLAAGGAPLHGVV